jgi:hypothetical protein
VLATLVDRVDRVDVVDEVGAGGRNGTRPLGPLSPLGPLYPCSRGQPTDEQELISTKKTKDSTRALGRVSYTPS